IVFYWFRVIPPVEVIFIPLILLSLLLMALGFGFILAIVNLVTRDISSAVGIFMTLGMFLAPILYPPPESSPFFLINILNPFSPALIATQDLIAHGSVGNPGMLMATVLFSILVFLTGWRVFHLVLPRVVERA
ncbi:MAG: hypothetical protein MI673_07585, partial [Thiotrichales bacterium]|nr:hypothetical protein [Thiotrichales bacterium]